MKWMLPRRLKSILLICFIAVIVIPLVITGYFTYFAVERVIETNTGKYVNEVLKQSNESVDAQLRDLVYAAIVMNMNERLVNLVKTENTYSSVYERLKKEYELKNILSDALNLKWEIYSVALFTEEHTYTTAPSQNLEMLRDTDWYRDIKSGKKRFEYIAKNLIYSDNKPKSVISLAWELNDLKTDTKLGVLLINIDDKHVTKRFNDISLPDSSLFLLDQNHNIFFEGEQNLLTEQDISSIDLHNIESSKQETKKLNNQQYFIIQHKSLYSNWYAIWFIPHKSLIQEAVFIRNTIFIIAGICVIIGLVVSFNLASRITIPIIKLVREMNQIRLGNLRVRVDYSYFYELRKLSDTFNEMMFEIDNLIERVAKEKMDKKKAEMMVLETQINPHFLYNTLDSIKWVAILHKADSVAVMITDLVKLYQISLSGGRQLITVGEELNHLKSYLQILKIRHMNKFEVVFDVPEEVMAFNTVKIILQPLVENAIYHGIEPQADKGMIYIKGDVDDGTLSLQISDNGVGIGYDSIQELFQSEQKNSHKMYKGLGMKNIDERIKLYFGEEYGLHFSSQVGVGTTVTITLPAIKGEDMHG